MAELAVEKLNVFKIFFIIAAFGISFALLGFLLLNPARTEMAVTYFLFWAGALLLLILDIVILDFGFTVSADFNSEQFLLQKLFPDPKVLFLVAIGIGLVWGGYYAYGVFFENQVFISVPDLFEVQPVTAVLTAQQTDILLQSGMVAIVEEQWWIGTIMPVLWLLFFGLFFMASKEPKISLIAGLVLASVLTGFLVAFVFHAFAYKGRLPAYDNAFTHFTLSSFIAGGTGTVVAGQVAHAIHNSAAKLKFSRGEFEVLPLQGYIETARQRSCEESGYGYDPIQNRCVLPNG